MHRALFAALVAGSALDAPAARAQQPVAAAENVGADLLTGQRLAALPARQRAEWEAYVRTSRELHARDTASMNAELRRAGSRNMTKAPYSAPSFEYLDRPAPWYRSDSASRLADAVLTFQTPSGGWSKRTDMSRPREPGTSYYAETADWHYTPTIDNGATTGQVRFLARVASATGFRRYADAYVRGLEYLLAAQQPNGCWPQNYPLEGGYHDAITFNDDAAVLVLRTLDEAASGKLHFVTPRVGARAAIAARRGVACLLATQVRVKGARTVWGQQHDPLGLGIVQARSYELPGLAGRESAGIMSYLMGLASPGADVVAAVHGAAAWFASHRVAGMRYEGGVGLRPDSAGPGVWARLTEVETDRPIFANRDGIRLYDWNLLADRRSGYAWYSSEPAAALKEYATWASAHPATPGSTSHAHPSP